MKREKQTNIRVTRDEFYGGQIAKEIEHFNSFSDYMRHLLRADLRSKSLWPPPQGPTGQAPAGGGRC